MPPAEASFAGAPRTEVAQAGCRLGGSGGSVRRTRHSRHHDGPWLSTGAADRHQHPPAPAPRRLPRRLPRSRPRSRRLPPRACSSPNHGVRRRRRCAATDAGGAADHSEPVGQGGFGAALAGAAGKPGERPRAFRARRAPPAPRSSGPRPGGVCPSVPCRVFCALLAAAPAPLTLSLRGLSRWVLRTHGWTWLPEPRTVRCRPW